MHSRQEETVEVLKLAQPIISAAQASSAMQSVAAQSGTRPTMQAVNTATQYPGRIYLCLKPDLWTDSEPGSSR